MKQFRSTFILLAITAAAVGYAYFFVYKKQADEAEMKEKTSTIIQLEKDKLNLIRFEIGKEPIELSKKDGSWFLTRPIQDSADSTTVNAFIDAAYNEKSDLELTEDKLDWAVFGLDQPEKKLVLGAEGGATQATSFGKSALGGKLYIRRNDENKVLVGNSTWQQLLDKSVKDLRNKDLYRLSGKTVEGVTLAQKGKPKITLSLKDGKWQMESPQALEADKEEVEIFISQVQGLKAMDVAAEDKSQKSKHGLSSPAARVELRFKDTQEPWVFEVSAKNKTQEVFVATSDLKPVYKAFGSALDTVSKKVADFRDKEKPFDFPRAEVQEINLKTDLVNVELVKKDGKWVQKNEDPNKEVDQAQVDVLINRIEALRAKDFVKAQSISPKRTLSFKNGKGEIVFDMGWTDSGGQGDAKVKTSLSPEVVMVESSELNTLPGQVLLKDKAQAAPSPSPGASPQASENS